MQNSVDIAAINNQLEKLAIDFRVRPLGDGTSFCWFSAVDNSYAMKVRTSFVSRLQDYLVGGLEDPRYLCKLFSEFEDNVKSAFVTYPYLGFLAKDYAEFYIEYNGVLRDEFREAIEPILFFIGNVSVKLSTSSAMLYFLYPGFEIDFNSHITIKLKGTSKENVEDDLYAALYYLRLVSPSVYGDSPRIVAAYPEGSIFEEDYCDTARLEKSHFTKPLYPIALRYFYHAESLWGEECLLYYYKVLEHFFDIAWRLRIIDLVQECGGDVEKLAQMLASNQPRSEKDYLTLVLERIESAEMWNYITLHDFPRNNLRRLVEGVYMVRNKVAHGKESGNFEVIVPSVINDLEIRKEIAIVRFLAELALVKLGDVDSAHNLSSHKYA